MLLGQSIRFPLRLPFQTDRRAEAPLPAPAGGPEPSLRGIRVLLAEDDELNMEIAQFLLEHAGMTVPGTPCRTIHTPETQMRSI